MKNVLYEKLIDLDTLKKLNNKEYKDLRTVDTSELSRVLSINYQKR